MFLEKKMIIDNFIPQFLSKSNILYGSEKTKKELLNAYKIIENDPILKGDPIAMLDYSRQQHRESSAAKIKRIT